MDTTFDFEQQRNRPPKYDRELYAQTIRAIQRISAIQLQRQRDFYYKRMKQSLRNKKMLVKREIAKNLDLVVAPVAQRRRQALMAGMQAQDMELDSSSGNVKKLQQREMVALSSNRRSTARRRGGDDDDDSSDDDMEMTVH